MRSELSLKSINYLNEIKNIFKTLTNSVYFDISSISRHEIFIYVRPLLPDRRFRRIKTASTSNFSKQSLTTSSSRRRIININVVIFGRNRFFDKRFIEDHSVDFHQIILFNQRTLVRIGSIQDGIPWNLKSILVDLRILRHFRVL